MLAPGTMPMRSAPDDITKKGVRDPNPYAFRVNQPRLFWASGGPSFTQSNPG
jgi:hypothetical protein